MRPRTASAMRRNLGAFGVSAVLGALAVTAPVLLGDRTHLPPAPISSVVRAAVENGGIAAALGLFIAGAVARYFVAASIWLVGFSTVAALPVFAIAEMLVDRTSHNLWPFEFVIYGIAATPGILGALAGHGLSPREYPVTTGDR